MTPGDREEAAARKGWLDYIERALGSSMISAISAGVIAVKLDLDWTTFFAAMVLYVNYSTKIEQIEEATAQFRTDRENTP